MGRAVSDEPTLAEVIAAEAERRYPALGGKNSRRNSNDRRRAFVDGADFMVAVMSPPNDSTRREP